MAAFDSVGWWSRVRTSFVQYNRWVRSRVISNNLTYIPSYLHPIQNYVQYSINYLKLQDIFNCSDFIYLRFLQQTMTSLKWKEPYGALKDEARGILMRLKNKPRPTNTELRLYARWRRPAYLKVNDPLISVAVNEYAIL